MSFKPGDRVYVTDPALAELRKIMRDATGIEPPPNHHGTVDSVMDGRILIFFDDGVGAPYDSHDVVLLDEPNRGEFLGDCDNCGGPIWSKDGNFGFEWDHKLARDVLIHDAVIAVTDQANIADIKERTPQGWYGLAVGRGWWPIVFEAHHAIKALHPDYEVYQIKEKFGGLRYYCSVGGDPEVRKIIEAAEAKAWETCERCGKPGEVRPGGWITTLCDLCLNREDNHD